MSQNNTHTNEKQHRNITTIKIKKLKQLKTIETAKTTTKITIPATQLFEIRLTNIEQKALKNSISKIINVSISINTR
jgi:plasmid maintenance system killer protein